MRPRGRIKIAINLSPTPIGSRNLVPSIVQTLAASRVDPGRLTVEITEAVLLRNAEATVATLYQLRSLGIQIALDDFGTGFSSLSYLRSFPFDKLRSTAALLLASPTAKRMSASSVP
jgi:EAL domain-containing protein (putative c-di-GMP-specific phosphodiesterase class I)